MSYKNFDTDKTIGFNSEEDFDFDLPFFDEEEDLVLIDDDELSRAIESGELEDLDDLITA